MSDFRVRFTQNYNNTSKVDEDDLFIVRFKQTLPPIYRVTLEVANPLLNKFIDLHVLLGSSIRLLLEKAFDDNTIVLSENVVLSSDKNLDQLVDVIDSITDFALQKRINETSKIDDIVLKKSDKNLVDAIDLDDLVDKQTGKTQDNEVKFDDRQFRDFMKSLSDFITVSVKTKFSQSKRLHDEAETFEDSNVFDGSLFKLQKSISSKTYIAENILLIVDTFRKFFEITEIDDDLSIDFGGFVADNSVAQELVTLIIKYIRAFNDQSSVEDKRILDFVKSNKDFSTTTDEEIFALQKKIDSNTTALDNIKIVFDAIRSFDEQSILTDHTKFSIIKDTANSTEILEEVFLELFLATPFFDQVTTEQSIELTFAKELTDTNIVIDFMSLVLSATKQDDVDIDEIITKNIDVKSSNISEIASKLAISLGTSFVSKIEIEDLPDKTVEKPRQDLLSIIENSNVSILKSIDDLLSTLDSIKFDSSKRFDDETETFEDSNVFDGSLFKLQKSQNDKAKIAETILLFLSYIRTFIENIDLVSLTALELEKIRNDQVSIQDVLEKVTAFVRNFVENITINEETVLLIEKLSSNEILSVSKLEKLLAKTIENTGNVLDESRLDFDKSIENITSLVTKVRLFEQKILRDEAVTFEDSNVFDGSLFKLQKSKQDKIGIAEETALLVVSIRNFLETIQTEDSFSVEFFKIEQELVEIDDVFVIISDFVRNFSENTITIDEAIFDVAKSIGIDAKIDDLLSVQFEKVIENEISTIDTIDLLLDIFLGLVDETAVTENTELSINKSLNNDAIIDEVIKLLNDYNRNLTNVSFIEDSEDLDFGKKRENLISVLDVASLALSIFAKDQINLVSEIINKTLQKSDKDALEVQIKLLRILNKVISDSPLLIDQAEKSMNSVLQDVLSVADQLQTVAELNRKLEDEAVTLEDSNVFDGSLYKLQKSKQDKILVQEDVDLLTTYFRVFSHTIDTTLEIQKQLSKSIENNTSIVDKVTISYLKSIESDLSVSLESLVLEVNKRLSSNALVDGTVITKEIDFVTSDLNSILELIAITLNTSALDFTNTTDRNLINTNKRFNNDSITEDSGEYFYQSYVKEDYFAEEYVGQKEFF